MKKLWGIFLVGIFFLIGCDTASIVDDTNENKIKEKEPSVVFTFINNSQYKAKIGLNVSEQYSGGFHKCDERFDLETEQQVTKTKNYENMEFNFCLLKYLSDTDILTYLVSLKKYNDKGTNIIDIIINNTEELEITSDCEILSNVSEIIQL